MTRLVIVEDHPMILEAVAHLFTDNEQISVVGRADTGEMAVGLIRELKPDVVILDMSLPDISGLSLCMLFLDIAPAIKVVFFSMHEEVMHIQRALRCGAIGYVLKSDPVASLLAAVNHACKGKYYFSSGVNPAVTKYFLGRDCDSGKAQEERFGIALPGGLSIREFQVLKLVLGGSTTKDISSLLCISPKTVEKHRANVMEKAKSRTQMDLFRFAVKNKILDPNCC